MSLINDALKKASGAGGKNSPKSFNYVHPFDITKRRRRLIKILILSGFLFSVIALCLVWFWLNQRPKGILFSSVISSAASDKPKISSESISHPLEISRTTIVTVAKRESGELHKPIKNTANVDALVNTSDLSFEKSGKDTSDKSTEKQINPNVNSGETPAKDTRLDMAEVKSNREVITRTSAFQTEEKPNSIRIMPVQFPELKINGIFYQKTRPSAIINGKTVFIGEEINGVKVISIDPESVTVQFKGEKRVIKM